MSFNRSRTQGDARPHEGAAPPAPPEAPAARADRPDPARRQPKAVPQEPPPEPARGTGQDTPGQDRADDMTGPDRADPTTAPERTDAPSGPDRADPTTGPVTSRADRTRDAGTSSPGRAPGSDSRPDDIARLTHRMDRAVGGFVDDPRRAVREADAVLDETARRLARLLEERRAALRESWDGDHATGTGTEELRLALTRYRDMTRELLHVG